VQEKKRQKRGSGSWEEAGSIYIMSMLWVKTLLYRLSNLGMPRKRSLQKILVEYRDERKVEWS